MRTLILACVVLVAACNMTKQMPVTNSSSATLVPVTAPSQEQATFALSKVVANISRGTVIAHYPGAGVEGTNSTFCNYSYQGNENTITWGAGTSVLGNWSTELGEVFHQALSKYGLNIAGDPTDLFGQNEAVGSAEYMIGGRITKIAGNICEDHDIWAGLPQNKFSGEMSVDVEWTIFSNLQQREVLTVKTQGYHKQANPIRDGVVIMFHNAFAVASENLLSSQKFVNIAQRETEVDQQLEYAGDILVVPSIEESNKPIEQRLEKTLSAIATVRAGGGHGSGFFISVDGLLLTNSHVVGESKNISVILNNGLEVPGRVVRNLPSYDLAIVDTKIRVPNALPIREAAAVKLEKVYVVGTPVDENFSSTVTSGIVSGMRGDGSSRRIQADAPISPGNSGGPLLDAKGNVLGISVEKIVASGSEGISFFIPIRDAMRALKLVAAPVS